MSAKIVSNNLDYHFNIIYALNAIKNLNQKKIWKKEFLFKLLMNLGKNFFILSIFIIIF